MRLRIYKNRKNYSDQKVTTHMIEKSEWKRGPINGPMKEFHLTFYCDEKTILQKGDTLEDYKKDVHRKALCPACVKVLQLLYKK